jgi:hypothetical protein
MVGVVDKTADTAVKDHSEDALIELKLWLA